jgi:hypothetical protein
MQKLNHLLTIFMMLMLCKFALIRRRPWAVLLERVLF